MRAPTEQSLSRTQRRLLEAWRRVDAHRWLENNYRPADFGDLATIVEILNREANEKLSRAAA